MKYTHQKRRMQVTLTRDEFKQALGIEDEWYPVYCDVQDYPDGNVVMMWERDDD